MRVETWCVCVCVLTTSPGIDSRVVLIVKVRLVHAAEGFHLYFSVLEQAQLGKQGQTHKPQLENTHTY